MNREELDQRIIELYDEHIRNAEDNGVKVSEAREAIVPDVVELVAAQNRDLDAEARGQIKSATTIARDKRSRNLKNNLDMVLDGFQEDGVYIDPLLDQAVKIGDEYGTDKTLRYWTRDDFQQLVVTRYRVAAETTKAASDTDETVQKCLNAMDRAGVNQFGELRSGVTDDRNGILTTG